MISETSLERRLKESRTQKAGSQDYRAFVGPPGQYDFMGATQFALLFMLGLREDHFLLDIGCGSLRAGRLLIPFLLPARYHGSEPNRWLVDEFINTEFSKEIVDLKKPKFKFDDEPDYREFNVEFDFIVAQSVLSHTGCDLIDGPIQGASRVLADTGQFLFTILDETAPNFDRLAPGNSSPGWHYPTCVTYNQADMIQRCERQGLHAQKLAWFHPRQSWFRAVRDRSMLLGPGDLALTGPGRPLFDERFR